VSRERVLVADDDPAIQKLLKLLVTRAGFEVDIASDGALAIEKLRSDNYLVFGCSRFRVCRRANVTTMTDRPGANERDLTDLKPMARPNG
jgi:DNA-binding response OmpR family regulator